MRLYHCARSRGLRALWTIEEIGLDCELVGLPFPPRRLTPGYLDLNPVGTVPTLVDGETILTESSAIAQYLAVRHSPGDLAVDVGEADHGAFLDFLHHADATLTFPQTVYLRYAVLERERGLAEAGDLYADWFGKRLAKVARRLETRDYLCAGRFTVADIAVAYAIFLSRRIGIADRVPDALGAWFDGLARRPAFQRALARDAAMVPLEPGVAVP